MRTLKTFPPLIPRLCSNVLPFFAGLALLLVATGLDVTIGTRALVQNWQDRLFNHVLVTLPPATSLEQTGALQARAAQSAEMLLQLLRTDPRSHDVKVMSENDIRQLMAQWGSAWTAPFPVIIHLTYNGGQHLLEDLVHQKFPQATVIFPPETTPPLSAIIRALQMAGSMVTLFLIIMGEAIFLLALMLSLSHGWQKQRATLKILFYSGCSEHYLWSSLMRQVGWRCLIGGYGGLFLMIPLINSMTFILQPVLHLPVQPDGLGNSLWHNPFNLFWSLVLILWPLLNCLAGCLMASLLFRHPSRHFYA
ncbi:hypothetical protein PT277_07705 [Acetobacteraceae bacterium ESL0709]|nr:hypothetical protein [Acetobacteraceae bacterium ESL0697]MDF7678563.1 hypothetical protein [Acetobacteraceae bacterium ESL0709]